MIKVANLREAAKYLPMFSSALCDYSYPLVNAEVEELYLPYTTWNFMLDGYEVCVHMNEFNVSDSVIQNLQIFPRKLYCLPFHVNFKIVVAMLGTEDLVSFSIVKHGHVVSCWTKIKNAQESKYVTVKNSVQEEEYMGVKYGVLQ